MNQLFVESMVKVVIDRLENASKVCDEFDSESEYSSSAGYSRSAINGSVRQLKTVLSEITKET
jgi:biotin operon repressor